MVWYDGLKKEVDTVYHSEVITIHFEKRFCWKLSGYKACISNACQTDATIYLCDSHNSVSTNCK